MIDQGFAPARWLSELDQDSREFVRLLAMVGVTPVPVHVLDEYGDASTRAFADVLAVKEPADARDQNALREVLQRSIAGVSLTRQARAEVRQELSGEELARSIESAVVFLDRALPADSEDPERWEQVDALVDHVLEVVTRAGQLPGGVVAGLAGRMASMLERVGRYFDSCGRYEAARDVLQRALAISVEHSSIVPGMEANIRRSLGSALCGLGDVSAARTLTAEALQMHDETGETREVVRDCIELAALLEAEARIEPALRYVERALELLPNDGSARLERGQIHRVRGSILVGCGQIAEGRAELERAVECLDSMRGRRAGLDAVFARATLGLALTEIQEPALGRELLENALRRAETVLGRGHPEVGALLSNLATACAQMHDLESARKYLERSLKIAQRVLPTEHPALFIRHTKLANALERQGEHQAELEHRVAAVRLGERLQADSVELVMALGGLARVQQRLGNHKSAETVYARALYVAEALDPADDKLLTEIGSALAGTRVSLGNLGGALAALEPLVERHSDSDEDVATYRLAVVHLIERLGPDLARAFEASEQPLAATELTQLVHGVSQALVRDAIVCRDPRAVLLAASLAIQADALQDAASGLERAYVLAGPGDGELGLELARCWEALARAYLSRGEANKAIATLERALEMTLHDSRMHGILLVGAAEVRAAAGQQERGIELLREAVELLERAQDMDGLTLALERLAKLLWDAGLRAEAIDTLEERVARARDPDRQTQLAPALKDLGHALRQQRGSFGRALEVALEAVKTARDGGDGRVLSMALLELGRTHEAAGELSEALEVYEERLGWVHELPTPDHLNEGVALHDLGDVLCAQGKLDEAILLYRRAAAHKRRTRHERELATTLMALAQAYTRREEDELALQALSERMDILEALTSRDQAAEADTLVYMAAIEQGRSRPERALELLVAALECARSIDDALRLAHTCLQASVAALAAGDDAKAAQFAGKAVDAFEGSPRPDVDGLALAHSVRARARRRDSEAVLADLLTAVRLYQQGQHLSVVAAASVARTLADTCSNLGLVELAAAIEHVATAMLQPGRAPLDATAGMSQVDAIRVELACGRLLEARQALGRASAVEFDSALSAEWLQLGRCLQVRGDHEQASQAFERALATAEGSPERRATQKALIRDDLAGSLRALYRHDDAIELHSEAAEVLEQSGVRDAVGVLSSLGRALYANDHYTKATRVLKRRLELLATIRADRSAEGVTLHDLGNVHRLRGQNKQATEYYRRALAAKREGGSQPRDLAITVLSLTYMLRRAKPAPAEEMADLAAQSEALLAAAAQDAESQSPKAPAVATEVFKQATRGGRKALARTAGDAFGPSVLTPAAIAGLVRISRATVRVPPPAQAEHEPGEPVMRELAEAALVEGEPSHPQLTAAGRRTVRLLWPSDAPSPRTELADELLLGAQLSVLGGDRQAALLTLEELDDQDRSLEATLARALQLSLGDTTRDAAGDRVREELASLLTAEPDIVAALGIATAAIDCDAPRLAHSALMLADRRWRAGKDGQAANGTGELDAWPAAEVGVAWHTTAVAFELAGDVDGSRACFDRATAALASLDVELEIAPMRHAADMLRFAGRIDEALTLEHATPFAPQPASTRVLAAATCLRAARLQMLLGRRMAGRALNWRALSQARFVPARSVSGEVLEPASSVGSAGSSATTNQTSAGRQRAAVRKPRQADLARVNELTPSGVALLELLREDEHDSALRGILPGLLIEGGAWRAVAAAARELEQAGFAEVWLRSGWLRLGARGAAAAAAF